MEADGDVGGIYKSGCDVQGIEVSGGISGAQ